MTRQLAALAALAAGAACLLTTTSASAATSRPRTFKNCTAMHRVYPHGVGTLHAHDKTSGKPVTNFKRNNALYQANRKSDRDHDNIACEAH